MAHGWDTAHTVFSYHVDEAESRNLNVLTKRLMIIFFVLLGVPNLFGLSFGIFNPLQIPGGGAGRGAFIALVCSAPALLSLHFLREKTIGGHTRRMSVAIIQAMGEREGFVEPLNYVLKRTPWSKYRIALFGGYRDKPHDIPVYLPNGNHLVVNFDDGPTVITLKQTAHFTPAPPNI